MCQSQPAPSTKVQDFSTNQDFQTGDRIASLHESGAAGSPVLEAPAPYQSSAPPSIDTI
jgi:hypothetical protein